MGEEQETTTPWAGYYTVGNWPKTTQTTLTTQHRNNVQTQRAVAKGRYNRYNTDNTQQSAFIQSLDQSPFVRYTDPITSTSNQESDFIKSERERLAKKLPIGTVAKKLSITAKPTYHVGGLNISDGMQQGVGLTPEVDMLGLIKSPTTNLETTTPQPNYMRLVNLVAPYIENKAPSMKLPTMKELPVEGLTFNKVYNKKDTRQWLWDLGIDPYTLTGRQRRKIRNDLNATGTTNFKINGVTPIVMKKGSKLIKKEEVCPKCGKIHKAGIGCAVAKFRYDTGGNIDDKKKNIDNYYLTDYSKPTISLKAKLNGKELTIKVNKGQLKGEDPITIQGNNYYLKGDSTLVKNDSIPYTFEQLRNAGINNK